MRPLGAVEALGRGLANVRGNLELVGVAAASSLVVTGLVVLSLVPVLGVGAEELASFFALTTSQGSAGDLVTVFDRAWATVTNLWGVVVALAIGLTIGSIVYSWVLGGMLAVLVAGEAQAPPGGGRHSELFRTWSWRFFSGEATRLVWRVLVFLSLWLLAVLAVVTLFGVLMVAAAVAGGTRGIAAGLALGCGGALPLLFLLFAVLGAMTLGQVELVPRDSGVVPASRAGLRLLGRRLAAAVALFALFFLASVAIGTFEAGVGLAAAGVLVERPLALGTVQGALFIVQLMLSAFLNLVLVASFVALVRGERSVSTEATA